MQSYHADEAAAHLSRIRSKARQRRAFSLVELLVVIGIIAVLISILLPALGKARVGAQRVQCASNMRQVSMALGMYLSQFQGHQPISGNNKGEEFHTANDYIYYVHVALNLGIPGLQEATAAGGPWFEYKKQAIGGGSVRKSVLFCPTEEYEGSAAEIATTQGGSASVWCMYTSYAPVEYTWASNTSDFCDNVFNDLPSPAMSKDEARKFMGKTLSQHRNTSDKALFAHVTGPRSNWLQIAVMEGGWRDPSYNSNNSHANVLPFAFLDGHVESIPWTMWKSTASVPYHTNNTYGPRAGMGVWRGVSGAYLGGSQQIWMRDRW